MAERTKIKYKAQYYYKNRSHYNNNNNNKNKMTHLITAWPRLLQIIIVFNILKQSLKSRPGVTLRG